jgi:hypothetical protein
VVGKASVDVLAAAAFICVPDDGLDYDCPEVDGSNFSVPSDTRWASTAREMRLAARRRSYRP